MFRYFRMAPTNQNCTYEKTKRDKIQRMPTTIWSRTFCFPVRHPKTHKIKYTYLQLFLRLCGCEPSCLTLTEEHRLLFKNRGLGEIFGPEREKETRKLRKFHSGSFTIGAAHRILLESSYQWGWDGQDVWHVRGEEKCITCCGGENFHKRPLARPRCKWEDNIKMDHK